MSIVKVSSRGQITLNKELRKALGAQPGDKLVLTVSPDGHLQGRAIKSKPIASLAGSLGRFIQTPIGDNLEELTRQAMNEAAVERHQRILEKDLE